MIWNASDPPSRGIRKAFRFVMGARMTSYSNATHSLERNGRMVDNVLFVHIRCCAFIKISAVASLPISLFLSSSSPIGAPFKKSWNQPSVIIRRPLLDVSASTEPSAGRNLFVSQS